MRRFCYLAQGRAPEIDKLHQIFAGKTLISLTWDVARSGSIFLPKSSWPAGRRALCHEALKSLDFDYLVFMGGDAIATPEELDVFETIVSDLRPAAAAPRVSKTERYNAKLNTAKQPWVLADDSDEQFQCFDVRGLRDHLGGSLDVSEYDDVSWCYPCVLNQKLICKHYWRSFIQVNGIVVRNNSHGSYPNNFDAQFIHTEAAKFKLNCLLPLSVGGGFPGNKRLGKPALSLDKRLFKILCALSGRLHRPFDPSIKPALTLAFQQMLR